MPLQLCTHLLSTDPSLIEPLNVSILYILDAMTCIQCKRIDSVLLTAINDAKRQKPSEN